MPVFALSPATEEQIIETEQQLGFLLLPLLRQLHLQIANGGFGPGYGIIRAIGGFPLLNGFGDGLVKGYRQRMRHCRRVHLDRVLEGAAVILHGQKSKIGEVFAQV